MYFTTQYYGVGPAHHYPGPRTSRTAVPGCLDPLLGIRMAVVIQTNNAAARPLPPAGGVNGGKGMGNEAIAAFGGGNGGEGVGSEAVAAAGAAKQALPCSETRVAIIPNNTRGRVGVKGILPY